ncbi:hypothetical protein ABT288_49805 [Streptomyces sp. NPDC001093]|uniref:hypothetical protein n=1 Tax=Streptomyces sp. NPDC001093 TaxID=3154376 RepID=UPI003325BE1F
METNYIGTWTVSGAFASVLSRNGGNALMLSAAPLAPWPGFPGMRPPAARRSTGALWEALREHS